MYQLSNPQPFKPPFPASEGEVAPGTWWASRCSRYTVLIGHKLWGQVVESVGLDEKPITNMWRQRTYMQHALRIVFFGQRMITSSHETAKEKFLKKTSLCSFLGSQSCTMRLSQTPPFWKSCWFHLEPWFSQPPTAAGETLQDIGRISSPWVSQTHHQCHL